MNKRVLFLGGSNFQLAPIVYAKSKGYHIITCDFLPENPGHQFADEYYNVSTTDKECVLKLAKSLKIDGIVVYASDPAAPTAAYVASQLQLPGNPYDSVQLLTRKDLYREFLKANGFNTPQSGTFTFCEEAMKYFMQMDCHVMVKPVDSSGSKGVSKVSRKEDFISAFEYAMSFSRAKLVIVEEFIERKGFQIAGDGFIVNGNLAFRCFAQEHFNTNCNPFVPVGESFPLLLPASLQARVHNEIQRLLNLLKMKTGALNFDIIFDRNDRIFLMEIGPRSGGNLIPDVVKLATGVDLIEATVEAAVGNEPSYLQQVEPFDNYSSYMLHAESDGVFSSLEIDATVENNIVRKNLFIAPNAGVARFNGSNHTLGYLILKFANKEEMISKMERMNQYVRIIVN